jgi:DNA-binding NarL/FixJ family response regulator
MTGLEGAVALLAAGGAVGEQRATVRSHLRLLTSTDDREPPDMIALDHRPQPSAAYAGTPIRVLVAAGQELMRASYRALLESDAGIQVVGEAGSCPYARALANHTAPEVAVLDLEERPGPAHLDTITAVVSDIASAGVASLLIAPPACDECIVSTLRAGAAGVLSRDAEPAELTRSVRALARGQALLPTGVFERPRRRAALAAPLQLAPLREPYRLRRGESDARS